MTTITQRLAMLRTKMREANIAAYIVPTTDEYLGEYVPEQNKNIWVNMFPSRINAWPTSPVSPDPPARSL